MTRVASPGVDGRAHANPTQRLYFLDALRIGAFGLLVLYHVGMYYVTWDFHVKSTHASAALEPWMKLTEPWRMSLLFLISGAATAFMWKSSAGVSGAGLRRRSSQLLRPLLFGVVVLVPPQAYAEVLQQHGYTGSYLDFLGLYFTASDRFCQSSCLVLPTWNHLWFLPYVWLYTVLLAGVAMLNAPAMARGAQALSRLFSGPGVWVLPVAVLWLLRAVVHPSFPVQHAMWGDWYAHLLYGLMFWLGHALATTGSVWWRFERMRWAALSMATVAWVVFAFGALPPLLHSGVVALFQWTAIVAALGFARRHLNRDAPLLRLLSEAVFPVYLLHQTVLIGLAVALRPWDWRPAVEGPVLVFLTFTLSLLAWVLLRRVRWLRPWIGLKASVQEPSERSLTSQAGSVP